MPALMGVVRQVAGLSLLRSSAVFALSGAAFASGTLLLARVMPVEQFGELSLLLVLFNIFCLLAPAGIDQVAVRHRLAPGGKLLGITVVAGGLLGLAIGMAAIFIGGVGIWEAAALGLSISVGGLVVSASGFLRARGRLGLATWVFTGGNWGLLLIGLLGQIVEMPTVLVPFGLFLLGQTLIAVIAWLILFREKGDGAKVGIAWREAAALVGMAAVGTLALQLERVLIPSLIGLSELALFSVLASVAIFPFRIVTAGLEFSLTPRLRAETDPVRRRALFRRELAVILAVLVVAAALILLVAPLVTQWITGSRYHLSWPLLLAACLNGAVKFFQTLPRSVLTACGSAEDLLLLNLAGGVGLALAVIGGVIGASYGLVGIILGSSLGTLVGNMPAFTRAKLVLSTARVWEV